MKKALCLSLVCLLFVSLMACGNPHGTSYKMSEDHYAVGKDALDVVESYLLGRIEFAQAKARLEPIRARLDALPAVPEEDPLYEGSDRVLLFVGSLCTTFERVTGENYQAGFRDGVARTYRALASLLGEEPAELPVD